MRGTASLTLVYVHPAEAAIEHLIEEHLRRRDPFVPDSEHAFSSCGAFLDPEDERVAGEES